MLNSNNFGSNIVRFTGLAIVLGLFLSIFASLNPIGLAQDDPHYTGGSVPTPNLILQDLGFCANDLRVYNAQNAELEPENVRLSELTLESIRINYSPTGACTISVAFVTAD